MREIERPFNTIGALLHDHVDVGPKDAAGGQGTVFVFPGPVPADFPDGGGAEFDPDAGFVFQGLRDAEGTLDALDVFLLGVFGQFGADAVCD